MLSEIAIGKVYKLEVLKDSSATFLQYAVKLGLGLSSKIKVSGCQEFDGFLEIGVNSQHSNVSKNLPFSLALISK